MHFSFFLYSQLLGTIPEVHSFLLCSCIIHSAVLHTGMCQLPSLPDAGLGSRADSESMTQSLPIVAPEERGERSLNNYICGKTCFKSPKAVPGTGLCCGTQSNSQPWPGAAPWLPSGLCSNSFVLEACPDHTPIIPSPLTLLYVSSWYLLPPDLTCIDHLVQNVTFVKAETLSYSLQSSQLLLQGLAQMPLTKYLLREGKGGREGGKTL